MAIYLFDNCDATRAFEPEVGSLKLFRLDAPGELLDAGYELLERVFDSAVIDTKETYVDLLSPDGFRIDGFALICVAAAFEHAGNTLVVGLLAANLMWIDQAQRTLQLAIGNIATSPAMLQRGVRGIGTALWKAAIRFAAAEAESQGAVLAYSVGEAEADSLGFWKKLGYLQPQGVRYLQPPLEFDETGKHIHGEVPETLLVRPLANRNQQAIDASVARQMVLAIYRNWSIETNRRSLSPAAIARAEQYVMDQVFAKVDATIPKQGTVRLAPPREIRKQSETNDG